MDDRIVALEREVGDLKRRLGPTGPKADDDYEAVKAKVASVYTGLRIARFVAPMLAAVGTALLSRLGWLVRP